MVNSGVGTSCRALKRPNFLALPTRRVGTPSVRTGSLLLVQVETSCRTAQPLSGLDEGERFVRVAPAYVWERF